MHIGQTMRPLVEVQRLQQRYAARLRLLAYARAYSVLAPVLWARFAHVLAGAGGAQWYMPDRRLVAVAKLLRRRDPEQLITTDELLAMFTVVFPEAPFPGIGEYRTCEAYIQQVRRQRN